MRILQLIPTFWVGGAERMAASLAICLQRAGHTVAAVSLFDGRDTWIERELRSEGVPLSFLGKRGGLDVRMIPRVGRALAAFRPDVLHTHMGVLKYALPGLTALPRCRVVHTIHNLAHAEVEPPSQRLQYVAFRAGVVPVAIGERVAESVRELYRVPLPRVIPNGVRVADCAADPRARGEIRSSLGIPADAPTFVAVGRLDRQKNTASLLRAFATSNLHALGAHLLLVGRGELQGELEELARTLGIDARVHFLGVRDDVPRVLAAADVFVLSSSWEGMPLSVMEAMSAGKPIVATAVGCIPELVSEQSGRLVAPGDEDALGAALHEFATRPELARAKGAAAALVALERFDVSVMSRRYAELYEEVVTKRSTRRREARP